MGTSSFLAQERVEEGTLTDFVLVGLTVVGTMLQNSDSEVLLVGEGEAELFVDVAEVSDFGLLPDDAVPPLLVPVGAANLAQLLPAHEMPESHHAVMNGPCGIGFAGREEMPAPPQGHAEAELDKLELELREADDD